MSLSKKSIFGVLGLLLAGVVSGQTMFLFNDGEDIAGTGIVLDDEGGMGTDTVGLFTISAEAFLNGVSSGTEFNGGANGFGINALGTGDETQRFDNDLGIESMVFSFNRAGVFQSIDLRYIEENANEAVLSFAGGGTYQLNSSTALSGDDDFSISETFYANQEITLQISPSATSGENFSLENFVVSVPEPEFYGALAGLLALGLTVIRRRRD